MKRFLRGLFSDNHAAPDGAESRFHNTDYCFNDQQIAFIHLPKTGGTSLHHLLQQDPQKRFVNLNVHRPISEFCPPHRFQYITILRSPVERVWSYYQMVLAEVDGYPYKKFAERGLSCFLENCWEVRDMGCRYYSGVVKAEPDTATMDIAFDHLTKFVAVLDFGSMVRDTANFIGKVGLPPLALPHIRRARYPSLSTYDKELIASFNKMDQELYMRWRLQRLDNRAGKVIL